MKILGVGIAALDIINTVDHYPAEDEEMRVLSQRVATGGNVTNTLTVLAQCGYACDFAGVLADDADGFLIAENMTDQGIHLDHAFWYQGGKAPTSYITLNQSNGSRTILHHRDLPELSAEHFQAIPLADYDWIHFEGRNVGESYFMLSQCNKPVDRISLEIEKQRDDIESLIPFAGTIMFSKAYLMGLGKDDVPAFLSAMHKQYPGKNLICAVGDQGAYGISQQGKMFYQLAESVEVIDTIGAGDTFNAGVIDGLCQGESIEAVLHGANKLAAKKVSKQGLLGFL